MIDRRKQLIFKIQTPQIVFRKMTLQKDFTTTLNKLPHHRTLSRYLLKCKSLEEARKRRIWCVLRKGMLSWYDDDNESETSELKGKVSIKFITSIDIIGDDFTFRVRSRNKEKTEDNYFSAESLNELSLWVRVLNDEHDIVTSSQ